MDIFKLSRTWFDFCFENPEKIKPNHSALYFFCIEHCNRLGWKQKFGLPTTMAKEAIGISSYNTYISTLTDLIDWGFIILIEKSKNQYSSNIIALSNYNKALNKALDKALIKHSTKQSESTVQSIDSINIQETRNKKQETRFLEIENKITPEIFYKSEIEKNENKKEIESYKKFVSYLNGNNEFEEPLTMWLKLPKQMTYIQYEKLLKIAKEKNIKIVEKLKVGYNTPLYLKNKTTVYQTLLNWINR